MIYLRYIATFVRSTYDMMIDDDLPMIWSPTLGVIKCLPMMDDWTIDGLWNNKFNNHLMFKNQFTIHVQQPVEKTQSILVQQSI